MNLPEIKRELRQIRMITKLIASSKRQIEELEYLKVSVKSPTITGMPKEKSFVRSDKVESIIDRIDELQKVVDEDVKRLIELKLIWMNRINLLGHDECLLLKLRYFEGWSWSDICTEMCYAERQVYRLHGEALKNLEKKLENIKYGSKWQ